MPIPRIRSRLTPGSRNCPANTLKDSLQNPNTAIRNSGLHLFLVNRSGLMSVTTTWNRSEPISTPIRKPTSDRTSKGTGFLPTIEDTDGASMTSFRAIKLRTMMVIRAGLIRSSARVKARIIGAGVDQAKYGKFAQFRFLLAMNIARLLCICLQASVGFPGVRSVNCAASRPESLSQSPMTARPYEHPVLAHPPSTAPVELNGYRGWR